MLYQTEVCQGRSGREGGASSYFVFAGSARRSYGVCLQQQKFGARVVIEPSLEVSAGAATGERWRCGCFSHRHQYRFAAVDCMRRMQEDAVLMSKAENLGYRDAWIVDRVDEGWKMSAVSRCLAIGPERVRQIVNRSRRLHPPDSRAACRQLQGCLSRLSLPARIELVCAGVKTETEAMDSLRSVEGREALRLSRSTLVEVLAAFAFVGRSW